MREQANKVVEWIRNYVRGANARGVVIGLSGGIDSAVVATLCSWALGEENVLGVSLPCHSDPIDHELASQLAAHLEISFMSIDLSETFDILVKYQSSLAQSSRMTQANIKARLRMTALMALASEHGYLNVGTGNKTELAIGYFTKFGDGGVDLEPIGDFYKTEVFEMAKEIGVPKEIINRPPTAGLWDGQTDEGELGMTYERIDAALRLAISFVDFNGPPLESLPKDKLDDCMRVISLIKDSEHKRHMPPFYVRNE